MHDTDLILSSGAFPPFASRGCQQDLHPMVKPIYKRTINGNLVNVSVQSGEKYHSIIRCHDQEPPAFDGLSKGEILTVHCIQRIWQNAKEADFLFARPHRRHTLVVLEKGQVVQPTFFSKTQLTISKPTETLVGYCPILTMVITDFSLSFDEWRQACTWQLDLLEV